MTCLGLVTFIKHCFSPTSWRLLITKTEVLQNSLQGLSTWKSGLGLRYTLPAPGWPVNHELLFSQAWDPSYVVRQVTHRWHLVGRLDMDLFEAKDWGNASNRLDLPQLTKSVHAEFSLSALFRRVMSNKLTYSTLVFDLQKSNEHEVMGWREKRSCQL